MWRDICLHNRDSLVTMIDHLLGNLAALRDHIAAADGDTLHTIFERTKLARDRHYE